jgi:DNA recombination protein RmuC
VTLLSILSFGAGLALGLVAAAAVWAATRTTLTQIQRQLEAREASEERLQRALSEAQQERARLGAELEAERKAAAGKLALLEDAEAKLRDAFSSLSSAALRQINDSFLALARASLSEFQQSARTDLDGRQKAIEELVQPLKLSLTQVDAKLQQVEQTRIGSHAALTEQLRSLNLAQQTLQTETGRLVQALRSPNVRGQWGELQLRRVVEAAGMLEYCDFDLKESVVGDEGRLTPDMIVRLPGGRNVVVDAKVPSSAYLDAMEAEGDAAKEARMRDHARQLRDHVVKLGNKTYWAHFQPTPDLVIMFVPGEMLLSSALQHDPGLLEFSLGRAVMLASPLTLMALLRAVAFGWQQEKIARNAQEISDLGRQLYERIRIMALHFEDVARGLTRSVESYNKAVGSLESRVLVTARRLKDKGVTAPEDLPELDTIDHTPRPLGAPELTGLFDDEPVEGVVVDGD